ncbi:MAG: hypothetical protein C6W57_07625 [Caldibacillus debilis]|nr:MAG: hypothetical protein C6W57_07625 [Caldibacillus debilis]
MQIFLRDRVSFLILIPDRNFSKSGISFGNKNPGKIPGLPRKSEKHWKRRITVRKNGPIPGKDFTRNISPAAGTALKSCRLPKKPAERPHPAANISN